MSVHLIMQLHLLWQLLGYRHTKRFGGIVVLSYSWCRQLGWILEVFCLVLHLSLLSCLLLNRLVSKHHNPKIKKYKMCEQFSFLCIYCILNLILIELPFNSSENSCKHTIVHILIRFGKINLKKLKNKLKYKLFDLDRTIPTYWFHVTIFFFWLVKIFLLQHYIWTKFDLSKWSTFEIKIDLHLLLYCIKFECKI